MREYIRLAQPIASRTLAEAYELGVSSATIRNEMAILEEHGLVYAPHTSAGRVPTQKGYRYFVQRLLTHGDLPPADRRRIAQAFREVPLNLEDWMRMAAMVLARTAQAPALVTSPRSVEHRFKHLELINTQGRLVLMVLVLDGGSVHQQLLTLAEPVPQRVLSKTAQILNLVCAHRTADDVRALARKEPTELARDIGELVADAMLRANQHGPRDIYRYGFSESLNTFTDDEAQQALRVLEEQSLLNGILQEALSGDQDDVRVVVAERALGSAQPPQHGAGALWHAAELRRAGPAWSDADALRPRGERRPLRRRADVRPARQRLRRSKRVVTETVFPVLRPPDRTDQAVSYSGIEADGLMSFGGDRAGDEAKGFSRSPVLSRDGAVNRAHLLAAMFWWSIRCVGAAG